MQSAFRATINQSQTIGTTFTKVLFPQELFDLNNEYNPATSTFVPAQRGVYLVQATISITQSGATTSGTNLEIWVNGNAVAVETESVPIDAPLVNTITVSAILSLFGGNTVEIFAFNLPVSLNTLKDIAFVHFEAARFPSPTE
ncbi:hypothetical protein ABE23_04720 [Bacillus thuringiensis]|nr:hypothetical protein [Bacillus thuringiensis]MBG9658982.1 hypothetical protein [Bacillus thuringiensis]